MTHYEAGSPDLAGLLRQRRNVRTATGPLRLGIGGGSASGKSTLAAALAERLSPLSVEVSGQDRFFKPVAELPPYASPTRSRPWPDYNRPDSFRVEEMLDHCRSFSGVDVVILEGILVLHYPEARALMDLRIYVDTAADERIVRRMRRNIRAGMDPDDVADYYLESVRFQHERYNAPTSLHADLIIPGGSAHFTAREALCHTLCAAVAGACSDPPAVPEE